MAAGANDERPSRRHKRSKRYDAEAKALGRRVRALRLEYGWTLEQAAERMDLDLKHVQKIESGQINVTLVTLVRLANGLGVVLAALFAAAKRS